jgi:DNA-binding transcriptional MerR regulator
VAQTVKRVAEIAGVSVRTLHHYDEIGLLRPARVIASGYRLYSHDDLERLQQILFFRELGFGLEEIREILSRPDFDRRGALESHRRLLTERMERLERLVRSVDRTLKAMEGGVEMEGKDMFDGFDPSEYEEEARQRWGHTAAYRESQRRTSAYAEEDWAEIRAEDAAIRAALASLMDRLPSDPDVQLVVERCRRLIQERFYNCPAEMYRGLGQMYEADPRFAANYDGVRPGLARFFHQAIEAYCDALATK